MFVSFHSIPFHSNFISARMRCRHACVLGVILGFCDGLKSRRVSMSTCPELLDGGGALAHELALFDFGPILESAVQPRCPAHGEIDVMGLLEAM